MNIEKKEIYKAETYKLETLSPVHIGTGIKLGNLDFYNTKNKVYVISIDKFVENLTEYQQEKLTEFIENNNNKDILDFVNKENIRDILEKSVIYEINLVDTGKIFGIWEEIKHPEGLYIPASTIKGAIRTAVLYCLLKENNYKFSIENGNIVLRDKNGKFLAKGLNEKDKNSIQNFLEKEFFGENQSNDIFKYLRISDSYVNKDFDNLECRKIYVANTTKFQDKNGRIKKHPEYYETICDETEFKNIKISIISEKESEKFIKPKYHKTLEKIKNWKQCLYEFSKDLIEAELKFWDKEDVVNMIKQAYGKSPHSYLIRCFRKDEVLRQLEEIQKENSPEEPVIRIGKLSGYLTHSIGLLLANNSGKPYDVHKFGKIINSKAKDWLFPLTRRLTLDNQTLGWCKLIFQKEISSTKASQIKNDRENTVKNKSSDELASLLAKKWGGKFRK